MSSAPPPDDSAQTPRPENSPSVGSSSPATGVGSSAGGAPSGQGPTMPAALKGLGRSHVITALSTVGVGYAAMVITAAIALGLALMGLSFSNASGGDSTGSMAGEELGDLLGVDVEQAPSSFRMLLTIPFQLAAMSLFGRLGLGMRLQDSELDYSGVPVTLWMPNLLILGVGIGAMVLWARWWARREAARGAAASVHGGGQPSRTAVLVLCLGAALAGAIVVQLITWITALRWSFIDGSSGQLSMAVSAASFQLMLGAFIVFAVVLWIVTPKPGAAGGAQFAQWIPAVRGLPRTLAVHAVVFCVPAAVALVIVAFVRGDASAGFSALLWLPSALVMLFGLGHLTGLTTSASGDMGSSIYSGSYAQTDYLWGLSAVPSWAVALIILLSVIAVLTASVSWAHQRGWRVPAGIASWFVLPVSYMLLGLVIQLLLPLRGRLTAAEFEAFGRLFAGLAPWTFLVFLLVGALIEVLARFVVPSFGAAIPASALGLIGGTAGAAVMSAPAAGGSPAASTPAAAQPQSPGDPSVPTWRGSQLDESAAASAGTPNAVDSAYGTGQTGTDSAAPEQKESGGSSDDGSHGTAVAGAAAAAAATGAGAGVISATAQPSYDAPESTPDEAHDGAEAGTADDGTRSLPVYQMPQDQQPGRAPAQPMGPPERTPEQKRRARWILLGIGAAALLVVLAIVTFQILIRTVFTPANQVEEAMNAVRDGEASRAVEIMDPNVPNAQRMLLQDDVYAVAGTPIEDYEITDVVRSGDRSTVTAEVTQDGVTTPLTFSMVRDGRTAGIFPQWRIEGAPDGLYRSVDVTMPEVSTMTLNGVETEIPEDMRGQSTSLVALPGDYSFGPDTDSKYLTYGDEQTANVRVADDGSSQSSIMFESETTPALLEDVTTAANAKLDECAAQTSFDLDGCPFGAYGDYDDDEDYRSPVWTIDEHPTYEVGEDYDGELAFSTEDSGQATVDYEYNDEWDDDEPADWVSRDDEFTISGSGTVTIDGDQLSVEFSD